MKRIFENFTPDELQNNRNHEKNFKLKMNVELASSSIFNIIHFSVLNEFGTTEEWGDMGFEYIGFWVIKLAVFLVICMQ